MCTKEFQSIIIYIIRDVLSTLRDYSVYIGISANINFFMSYEYFT